MTQQECPGPRAAAAAGPSADRYLEVNGARLRYRDDGQGIPVVLIHGWALDLDMWEPQVEALRDRCRLVRFDRRGFGLSSGFPDLAADANDVLALCRHLHVERAVFVGMSQGARVLERLVQLAPESILGLVFDGAPDMRPGGTLTSADVPIARYTEVARSEGLPAFRRLWSRHPLSLLVTRDPGAHELLKKMLDRYPAKDLLHAAPAAADSAPFRPESVRIPSLVMNGERDVESRRRAAVVLAQALPACELASIPNAGHLSNLDNPSSYNDILKRFIEKMRLAPRL